MTPAVIYLSCANNDEAAVITKKLLAEKLIACSKAINMKTGYIWNGAIENGDEVLLIMDTIDENFEKIELEVLKLHSHEQISMFSLPMNKRAKGVDQWLKESMI